MHALTTLIARLTAEIANSDEAHHNDLTICAKMLTLSTKPNPRTRTLVPPFLQLAFSPTRRNHGIVLGQIREIAAYLASDMKEHSPAHSEEIAVHILLMAIASGEDLIAATKRAILAVDLSEPTTQHAAHGCDTPVTLITPIGLVQLDRLVYHSAEHDGMDTCYRIGLMPFYDLRPSINLDDAHYATREEAIKILFDILEPVKTAA